VTSALSIAPAASPEIQRLPVEEVPPGEAAAIQHLIDTLQAQLKDRYPKGVMRRDAHPKHYGLVKASFTVDREIPVTYRHGIFRKPGRTFDAKIRFSSGNPIVNHDLVSDLRGFAIKLLDVRGPGDTPLLVDDPAPNDAAHDFVMATGEAFFGRDAVDFVDFPRASDNVFKVFLYFARRPRRRLRGGLQLLAAQACPRSPLDAYYFSQTPYRFGPHCVKYQVRRTEPWPRKRDKWYRCFGIRHLLAIIVTPLGWLFNPLPSSFPGFDVLRNSLRRDLASGPATLEFLVQRWPDLSNLPVWAIENATRRWSAPWDRLATIQIASGGDYSDDEAERIAFNPWRVLPEHQPAGSISRARRRIYEEMSAFRNRPHP
jgi:hypothetical protein